MKAPVNAAGFPLRERALFFGPAKTGKSSAWLSVASMHQSRGSNSVFYAIDTDFALNRMLMPGSTFGHLTNVVYEECSDWHEIVAATNLFRSKIKDDDFLIVDMVTPAWPMCQGSWIKEVYGQDLDTLMSRKMVESKIADKGNVNMGDVLGELISWPAVNRRYDPWAQSLISQPGHLVLVASQSSLGKREEEDVRQTFGMWGVKPDANKRTPHLVHDIYRFQSKAPGTPPVVSSVGRPGRPVLNGVQVSNWGLQVLVPAGWSL